MQPRTSLGDSYCFCIGFASLDWSLHHIGIFTDVITITFGEQERDNVNVCALSLLLRSLRRARLLVRQYKRAVGAIIPQKSPKKKTER